MRPAGSIGDVPAARTQAPGIEIGQADPADSGRISALYERAYGAPGGSGARDHYPFPQFMDPDWLRKDLLWQGSLWTVARAEGAAIGVIGALRNIGENTDGIAEFYGLVVDDRWRGHGIATRVYEALVRDLSLGCRFMIAETRTANSGGWRTARKFRFFPMGFEPIAHQTPAGAESMLLLGWRNNGATRGSARSLDHTPMLARLAGSMVKPETEQAGPGRPAGETAGARPAVSIPVPRARCAGTRITVSSWDGRKAPLQLQRLRVSAAVGLRRIMGSDPSGGRYLRLLLAAGAPRGPDAGAVVTVDRIDRRGRISHLHACSLAQLRDFLPGALRALRGELGASLRTLVLEVPVRAHPVHRILEANGFFPTVFYPGMLHRLGVTRDVVQYTLMSREDARSLAMPAGLEAWPGAARVVRAVLDNAAQATRRSPAGAAP